MSTRLPLLIKLPPQTKHALLSSIPKTLSSSPLLRQLTTTTSSHPSNDNLLRNLNSYVHPLSQIVLEHLQSSHANWLQRTGLDRGLELKKDGTFVLTFPKREGSDGDEESKLWTSYEPTEKKHWLIIKKDDLVGRYLLQDNLKPAWHSSKLSTPEKVQAAVDEMIEKISEAEVVGK